MNPGTVFNDPALRATGGRPAAQLPGGAMVIPAGQGRPARKDIIEFGPFKLRVSERLLEKEGVRVSLGSRALDILIALLECAPEVVNKRSLIARVWPDLVVDEGSLRFHIGVLRKALGEKQSGTRYVSNVAGRGYCFVAPISNMASRHETPSVAFDWRYSRLAAFERMTLRRLSVFGGMFSLEAVQSVFVPDTDRLQLIDTIAALVEKSFVVPQLRAAQRRYRIPGTMRDYLRIKLAESGEHRWIARRYAMYCMQLLEQMNADAGGLCDDELIALYEEHAPNVRAALQWSFSDEGDAGIGTALAARSAPLFSRLRPRS